MLEDSRFRQVSIAVGVAGTLMAVTAFGVAPLTTAELPPGETLQETVALSLPTPIGVNRFVQADRVRRGDTLASLLGRLGAIDATFQQFVTRDAVARKVLDLRPGRTVLVELDDIGRVMRLSYRLDGLEDEDGVATRDAMRIVVQREGDRFVASEEAAELERATEVRTAQIQGSFFAAADAAGIPDAVSSQIADIFGDSVNFDQDLRRGDRLKVIYETLREADSFDAPAPGRVLAAEIVVGGKRYSAVRFERDGDAHASGEYFGYDGKSLRKAFLRSPLEFNRVSSAFTESRFHPVLKDWRAHKGVDFAAPNGTKVRSVGDGTVEFVGQQRGYGNVVFVHHDDRHTTVYAHLSRFPEGLKVGDRVAQGDVIGFVGQTGWATGPHLHYEFRINGEQADPLNNVAIASGTPLTGIERRKFGEVAYNLRERMARLETLRTAQFE